MKPIFRDPTIDGGVQNAQFSESKLHPESVLLFVTAARASIHCLHVTLRTADDGADVRKYTTIQDDAAMKDMEDCRVMALSVIRAPSGVAPFGKHLLLAGYADGSIRVRTIPLVSSIPASDLRTNSRGSFPPSMRIPALSCTFGAPTTTIAAC